MLRDYLIRTMDDFHLRPLIEKNIGKRDDNCYLELKNKRKIFLMMMPTYGNLGDQAIALGTLSYLRDFFPEYEIIEINLKETNKKIAAIKKVISEDDIVILQGGGNLGNLYQYIEDYRRTILDELYEYKIVSMPVTATFSNNTQGKKELENSKKIYSKCKNLTIIAREEKSYNYLRENFPKAKIQISPDMAFYLVNMERKDLEWYRQGTMLCLRRDWEKINSKVENLIIDLFDAVTDCRMYDTYITREVPPELREIEVRAALKEFASSKLVITDRLHAMVMSVLTNTPCIVTRALDWKIEGTYQWIKECPYIRFVDSINTEEIKILRENIVEDSDYDLRTVMTAHFETLKAKIIS